ncbi:MAG TPA: STAS domain-containing protein [Thermotogota bacterium]|nr:STAS domain-containing protein [Thermotogota bacterium]HRW34517.1 STAS domain-containing protein [Thermotogota bacterium]
MLKWEKKGDWVVVNLVGELDMSNAIDFKNQIINEFVSKGELNIALDFENMEYIDSSGLGVIVSLHKRCKLNGGRLAIFSLNDTLTRLFKLTSLDKALNLYPDIDSLVSNG